MAQRSEVKWPAVGAETLTRDRERWGRQGPPVRVRRRRIVRVTNQRPPGLGSDFVQTWVRLLARET